MANPQASSRTRREEGPPGEPLTVPVWVDEFRTVERLKVLRLAYLAAEAVAPTEAGRLPLPDLDIPMIATGLVAALCQPTPDRKRFESADDLETLFGEIERSGRLSVETPDLWLPLNLFQTTDHTVQRGNVYRIDPRLLAVGVRFRGGRISRKELLAECGSFAEDTTFAGVTYSAEETRAFGGWSELQVKKAITEHRELKRKKKTLSVDEKRDEGRRFTRSGRRSS